jgi:GMP synthase (glutamine-hydrolysing)
MDKIIVLDCGGQYTHLIARKVRDLGVYSEILPVDSPAAALRGAKGFIISGGPSSVYDLGCPQIKLDAFDLGLPALGICYGHQLMAQVLNGAVRPGDHREFGAAEIDVLDDSGLLQGLHAHESVWMSHGDLVMEPPPGFRALASTPGCQIAAMGDDARHLYGVQFHVEVTHTPSGRRILSNFVHEICGCGREWSAGERVATLEEQVRQAAGARRVFFFVSGGVDSAVAFTLATRALGKERVHGAYIDTGFMRKGETREIGAAFLALGYDLEIVDAGDQFFKALEGVSEPEAKRQIIGDMFIAVQDQAITRLGWGDDWVLGQGTIYPDTIESGGTKQSAKIKTHHNRVGKVGEMIRAGRILEPISELYKDEVREVGRKLELPRELIERHPFPGPGLAIRCLCCTEESVAEGLPAIGGYAATRLPLRSVGVQGDFRSYAHPTLLWGGLRDHAALSEVSGQITNTQRESNRVTYLLGCRVSQSARSWRVHPAYLTRQRVALLQEADGRVRQWLHEEKLMDAVWQFPVVLLPLAAGKGSGETIVLRPVESEDGMTAHVAPLDFAALDRLTARLLELPLLDAVLLDISHKPPATIEWE